MNCVYKFLFFVEVEIMDTHFIKSHTGIKILNVVNNQNKFKLSFKFFFMIGYTESIENVVLCLGLFGFSRAI